VAFTVPLLPGTDGERKMSKTFDNQVGLTDPPEEQFGKAMSIPDDLIPTWLRLCTALPPEDLDAIERGLADGTLHPAEQKRRLAAEIVSRYHGADQARAAAERFDRVHREHEIPERVPEASVPGDAVKDGRVWLPRLLAATGLATSNADGRRLIEQGGVRIDGEAFTDPDAEFAPADLTGRVLQVGRRRFLRLTP
jgi:tyrosyl-tRNA synthetase